MLADVEIDPVESGCVSGLQFDAIASGDRSFEEAQGLREHLEGCERCRRRWREISEFAAGASARLPPFAALVQARESQREAAASRPRSGSRSSRWAFVGLAAALASALFLGREQISKQPVAEAETGTRGKGSARLGFYVRRGASALRGGPGELLYPGDSVSFSFSSAEPGFVGVFSLDASGQASVYYPSGSRATPLSRGEQLSKGSVLLDAVIGPEELFGVFCEREFALEPLRGALQAERTLRAPPGCGVDHISVEKRER
jgi:hypothetical protein